MMVAEAANAAPAGGDGGEPPQPQGLLDRLFPILRMFLIWYAFQSFMGGGSLGPQQRRPAPAPTPAIVNDHDVLGAKSAVEAPGGVASSSSSSAVSTGAARTYRNAFAPDDGLSLRVYVTQERAFSFADVDAATEHERLLRWHQQGLAYSAAGNADREDAQWTRAINVTVDSHLLANGSLFAHVFVTKDGFSPNPEDDAYQRTATIHRVVELTTYRPRPKIVKTRNLLQAAKADPEEAEAEPEAHVAETDDGSFVAMWKPFVTVNLVFDTTVYSSHTRPPPFLAPFMELDAETETYSPVVHVNEFWLLEERLMPINGTLAVLPLELAFYPLPLYKFALYTQMEQNFRNQEATGTSTRRDTDNMKRMFLETNPYLLAVTIVVSLLHSLFDFLAFKNDVSFWKNQKSLAGLSLRTIVLNTFFQLVIFLYLLDNDTSWMVLVSSFISLLIDIWKIKKAIVVSRDANNRLVIKGVESYDESPTATYDRIAVAHLSYVLYPLIVGHAAYSLAYGEHKGWYSWVLKSLTSFVYAFGFIMMTPQLYINYKLKSVAHLPWRAMVYKSLNTFIDDLFAFVIKMPWMHRLSCFRDDLIFFIYLYQRWIYPVDAKRTNEFGQGPIEDDGDGEDDGAARALPSSVATLSTTETASDGAPAGTNGETTETVADAVAVEPVVATADAEETSSTEYLMSRRRPRAPSDF